MTCRNATRSNTISPIAPRRRCGEAGVNDATVSFTGRDGTIRVPSTGRRRPCARDRSRRQRGTRRESHRGARQRLDVARGDAVRRAQRGRDRRAAVGCPSGPGASSLGAGNSAALGTPPGVRLRPRPPHPRRPRARHRRAPPRRAPAPSTPAPSSATLAQVQSQLTSLRKITFASGSARMTALDNSIAQQIAAIMRAHPEVRIQIQGDTDSVGPAAFNLTMSRMRARAVYNTLIADGIVGQPHDRRRLRRESPPGAEQLPGEPRHQPTRRHRGRRLAPSTAEHRRRLSDVHNGA